MSELKLADLLPKKIMLRNSKSTIQLKPVKKRTISAALNKLPEDQFLSKKQSGGVIKLNFNKCEFIHNKEDSVNSSNSISVEKRNLLSPKRRQPIIPTKQNSLFIDNNFEIPKNELFSSNQIELNKSGDSDNVDEKIRDENEIKKLNFWELEHYILDTIQDTEKSNSSNNVSKTESLNFIKEVKETIDKLRLKKNSQLKDFNKKTDEEQGTILMQNIKVTKKRFNFDVFLNGEKKKNTKKPKTGRKLKIKEKTSNDSDSSDIINENLFKENDIKLNFFGSIDSLRSPDLYRGIIKSKTKLENSNRLELMRISQKIYEKKKLKNKLNIMISDCSNYLLKLQNMYTKEKDKIDLQKIEAERDFENQIKDQDFDYVKPGAVGSKKRVIGSTSIEFMEMKADYQRLLDSYNEQQDRLAFNYNIEKGKLTMQMLEHKKSKNILEKETKNFKSLYNNLAQEQRVYYIDIVKKGIDVRYEGLSWAIKRLIELSAHLDYSIFPRFLDHGQVDYLLKYSYKQVESAQFKIMLKALKTRQKKMRDDENADFMRNSKSSFKSNNTSTFLFQASNGVNNINKASFSNKTMKHFDNVFQKYDKLMKSTYEQKIEDINIQNVVKDLKSKLKYYKGDKTIVLDDKTGSNIMMFFEENKRQKEYFEEILLLRQKIEELENEIALMKEESLKNFRRKYDSLKSLNSKFSVQYDLIYSALFGNSIII